LMQCVTFGFVIIFHSPLILHTCISTYLCNILCDYCLISILV